MLEVVFARELHFTIDIHEYPIGEGLKMKRSCLRQLPRTAKDEDEIGDLVVVFFGGIVSRTMSFSVSANGRPASRTKGCTGCSSLSTGKTNRSVIPASSDSKLSGSIGSAWSDAATYGHTTATTNTNTPMAANGAPRNVAGHQSSEYKLEVWS